MGEIADSVLEAIRNLQAGAAVDQSFRIVFDCYHLQVFRYFQRKGMPQEDCRDLTQDVFVSVYRGAGGIRDASTFEGWLFRIAHNAFVAALSRKFSHKRAGIEIPIDQPSGEAAPNSQQLRDSTSDALASLLEQEKASSLRQAMNELPEQMRRCVLARVLDDRSYGEIATDLGISTNTVRVHLFKAREQLGRKLRAIFGEPQL